MKSKIISLSFFTSIAFLTKESPIHSISSSMIKDKSSLSFMVKQGSEIVVLGKFTPLLDFNSPPKTTFNFTLFFSFVSSTDKESVSTSSKSTLCPVFYIFREVSITNVNVFCVFFVGVKINERTFN